MTNVNVPGVLLFVALIVGACSSVSHKSSHEGEAYRYFTEDGAWCWFSDPRAVYYEGTHKRTYSGWVDSTGNIVVAQYDHDSDQVVTHVLHEKFERDDHDNPSFLIDRDGRLMVFYTRHSTGKSPIFLARASAPENITQWEPVQKLRLNDSITYAGLSNTYTYTNIVRLEDEADKLFLFWRGADFKPNFSTSEDHGRTWNTGEILVLPERIYRDRRPYLKVHSDNKAVIHFAFTDGHPHVEPTNSIYYMKYRDGGLYKANGERIASLSDAPVDPATADLAYDARMTGEKAWIWDVAETSDGHPVVVYARFPTDTLHVYYYNIFDGIKWNEYRLTDAGGWFPENRPGIRQREPNYSGGIILDHADPSNVYLSRETDGVFEIEHWHTPDKGKTWKVNKITTNSAKDNVRPFVVRGPKDRSPLVLWMNVDKYIHYTNYRTSIRMSLPESGR